MSENSVKEYSSALEGALAQQHYRQYLVSSSVQDQENLKALVTCLLRHTSVIFFNRAHPLPNAVGFTTKTRDPEAVKHARFWIVQMVLTGATIRVYKTATDVGTDLGVESDTLEDIAHDTEKTREYLASWEPPKAAVISDPPAQTAPGPWLRIVECELVDWAIRVPPTFFNWANGKTFAEITFDWIESNPRASAAGTIGPLVSHQLIGNTWSSRLGHAGLADGVDYPLGNLNTFQTSTAELRRFSNALNLAWDAWLETKPCSTRIPLQPCDKISVPLDCNSKPLIIEFQDRPRRYGFFLEFDKELGLANRYCEINSVLPIKEVRDALAKLNLSNADRPRMLWQ